MKLKKIFKEAIKEALKEVSSDMIKFEEIPKLEMFAEANQKLRTELEKAQNAYRDHILNGNHERTLTSIQKLQLENRIREAESENRELHNKIVLFKNERQKIFFVVPECEYYKEDGTCKRSQNNKKYLCNELYCEQKIERKGIDPNAK